MWLLSSARSNGQIHCGCVVVAWQLSDTNPGDGGFATIPGTHSERQLSPDLLAPDPLALHLHLPPDLDLFCCHAIRTENNFPVPMEIRTLEKYGQYVREMTARAGDVIIFPEALVCLPPSPSLAVGRP